MIRVKVRRRRMRCNDDCITNEERVRTDEVKLNQANDSMGISK